MKKEGLFRYLMLAAGFVAMVGILCSQTFFHADGQTAKAKATTEQSSEKQQIVFQAPSDAIPGHAVQVDDSSAFHFIATLFEPEDEPELPLVPAERIGHFFEVLFRTLIAPNAP